MRKRSQGRKGQQSREGTGRGAERTDDHPIHPRQFPLLAHLAQVVEQLLRDALSAVALRDVQVFEVETAATGPGGEGVEVDYGREGER